MNYNFKLLSPNKVIIIVNVLYDQVNMMDSNPGLRADTEPFYEFYAIISHALTASRFKQMP